VICCSFFVQAYGESFVLTVVVFMFHAKSLSVRYPGAGGGVAVTSINRTEPRSLSLLPSTRTQAMRLVHDEIAGRELTSPGF